MGTVFIDFKLKMRFSVCSLPVLSTALILLLQVHQDMATFPITIGAVGAAGTIALTAPQVTAIAGLAVLTKIAGVAGGLLLSRALANRGGSRRGGRRYGKRSVQEEEELELEVTLKMLSEMEPEHCYKRVICAANTGKYYNQKLDGIMSLINEKATDLRASKFLAAAQYGFIAKDVAKCQHRYQCSMDLEFIQTVF